MPLQYITVTIFGFGVDIRLEQIKIQYSVTFKQLQCVCFPVVTLHSYQPHSYKMPEQNSGRVVRNPTIKISRATRALRWNVSLDREIQDPKELRNLDEFLGNQVRKTPFMVKIWLKKNVLNENTNVIILWTSVIF